MLQARSNDADRARGCASDATKGRLLPMHYSFVQARTTTLTVPGAVAATQQRVISSADVYIEYVDLARG